MVIKTPADLGPRSTLLVDKHAQFIKGFADEKETFLFYATEHFRLSGVYWGVTGLQLLHKLHLLEKASIVDWVLSCQHSNSSFGGSERHDPHLLHTLSAVQILALYGELHRVDAGRIARYVAGLQQPDGSFFGDEWGEVDTRFSYCALACCSLLGKLSAINVPKAAEFVARCKNFDGGFGVTPGNESHAAQTFTCVAALAIADSLHLLDADQLCWWLCERQRPSGGLNGRPEKLEDVCYSWWCLTSLKILGRMHWIDGEALTRFILSCQDEVDGGISDRADDECDVYHTFFGIAALSMLDYPGLDAINPVYALPESVVQRYVKKQQE